MNIGLWIPHDSTVCPGVIGSATTLLRIHYTRDGNGHVYIPSGCLNYLEAGNDVLASFQTAQSTFPINMAYAGKVHLTLSVAGTYNFMPSVKVNTVTYLTTNGSATVNLAVGTHSLQFDISPVAPGAVPTDGINMTALLSL